MVSVELANKHYKELYEEMMNVNEENVQGEFFVSSVEELKMQATNYLVDEQEYDKEDVEDIEFNIHWRGVGLYSFWGLGFISDYSLAHITEIFETETGVNPLIYLGNEAAIEIEKEKWYESDNFVYVVSNYYSDRIEVYYNDEPLEEDDNLKSIIPDSEWGLNYHYRGNYFVEELRQLDNYAFYEFLRYYAELLSS